MAGVQPTKFELVINPKTAKTLGISIPQGVVAARGRGDPMTDRVALIAAVRVSRRARHLADSLNVRSCEQRQAGVGRSAMHGP